jgi:hypothetical protein
MSSALVCAACGETGPGVQIFTTDTGAYPLCFDLELCERRVQAKERTAGANPLPPPAAERPIDEPPASTPS